ncbi:MAG: hypothetical protein WC966_11405 [Bradymonadales bacterium]
METNHSANMTDLVLQYRYLVLNSVGRLIRITNTLQKCDQDDLYAYGDKALFEGLLKADLTSPFLECYLAKTIKYKLLRGLSEIRGNSYDRRRKERLGFETLYATDDLEWIVEREQIRGNLLYPDATGMDPVELANAKMDLNAFMQCLNESDRSILAAYFTTGNMKSTAEIAQRSKSFISCRLCKIKKLFIKFSSPKPYPSSDFNLYRE